MTDVLRECWPTEQECLPYPCWNTNTTTPLCKPDLSLLLFPPSPPAILSTQAVPAPTPSPSDTSGGKERVSPLKRPSSDPPATKKPRSQSRQPTLAAFFAPPSSDTHLPTDHQLALPLHHTPSPSVRVSLQQQRSLVTAHGPDRAPRMHRSPRTSKIAHRQQTRSKQGKRPFSFALGTFARFHFPSHLRSGPPPVGPGYDRGKGERLREQVDHRYRCNFFMWSAHVRRAAQKKNGADSTMTLT